MKYAIIKLMLCTLLLPLVGCFSLATHEMPLNITLDKNWKFHKGDISGAEQPDLNDSSWQDITIPHTWNTDLINGNTYYRGTAWYRTEITIPENLIKKRLFLRFEGVGTVADVYLNGKFIGEHQGGYSAFCFEITKNITPCVNILAVKVSNAYNNDVTPVSDKLFTRFGGIYRPVHLLVKNQLCITPLDFASSGVYVTQKNVSEKKADLNIRSEISNGTAKNAKCTVQAIVRDAAGKAGLTLSKPVSVPVGKTVSVETEGAIDAPHLWDGKKDPYLYSVEVKLIVNGEQKDAVTVPLGLRYYSVDPRNGFSLNGKYLNLYGVSRHQEWEKEGSALTDKHHEHDIAEILNLGANALRLAHYQQAETIYELCDKNGLIVWAEVPVTPKYQKDNPAYKANCRQQLTELIRQNYNHPSILFWGLYNEVKIPDKDVEELYKLAKKEDPTRLVTAASDKPPMHRHTIPDLQAWNKYPGWYGRLSYKVSSFVDNVHRKYPDLCVGISEYGAGGCIDQHQLPPRHPNPSRGKFFPEEYQCAVHETVWKDIKDRKDIWCKFIWNMFDFSWPPVNRGNRPHMNHKGLITYDRKVKKDVFFFYKANWSDQPVVYITSRRFTDRKSRITDIKVYSNLDEVELYVNGKARGMKKPNDIKIALWKDVKMNKGRNIITVKGHKNGQILSDSCKWNYTPQDSGHNK